MPLKNFSKFLSIVLVLFFATPSFCFAAPPAAQVSSQSQTQILQACIKAYGGAETFKKALDAPFKGKAQKSVSAAMSGASNVLDLVVYGSGDKFRIETTVLGEKVISGFDGQTSWTQFGDWISQDTQTSTNEVKEQEKHGLKAILDTKPTKVESLAPREVAGRMCDVVQITSNGSPTTFYIDRQNHLILRSEYTGLDREQGVSALRATEYQDYKPLAGSLMPYKTVEYLNSTKTSETTIQEIVLTPVSASLFVMPTPSEVAEVKYNPVTIPFDFTGNYIIVKVLLNGTVEEKFIVDTGASQTVLDKSVAQKLGPYAASSFSITAGSQALSVNYTTLSSFAMGSISMERVPALIHDLSAMTLAPGTRIGGLIGANVLKRFLVTIDFHDKKLILANPQNVTVPKKANVIPMIPVFGAAVPVVKAQLDNKVTANFLVDTGASFNNLPSGIARPLLSGQILPVAKASGIDGQKVSMGSVRLKTLKLGEITIPDPVFAVSPNQAAASPSGLFTASAMGILGNPIWKQFRSTFDYRNERIILEPLSDMLVSQELSNKLKQIRLEHLKTKNYNLALTQLQQLIQAAQSAGTKSIEALAMSATGSCYVAAMTSTKNSEYATMASTEFQKALDVAKKSGDKSVEARVLAEWAELYIKGGNTQQSLQNAQSLIAKASSLAPTEAAPYAAMGTLLTLLGRTDMVGALWDQTLMLDPTNWTALWGKYDLAKKQNDAVMQNLVAQQLKRYYPHVPDVVSLTKTPPKAPAKTTP